MTFITENSLSAEIRLLFAQAQPDEELCCAVAFWGSEAINLLRGCKAKRVRIICNLESGATNPDFLASARELSNTRVTVATNPRLHAKVYWSESKAIVGSANASANGLGLSDGELAFWIEAASVHEAQGDIKIAKKWFESLWDSPGTREVNDADIQQARMWWRQRKMSRPTNLFGEFPEDELINVIPVWWEWPGVFREDVDSVETQLGRFDAAIKARIENGVDIEAYGDEANLKPGQWILWWKPTAKRRVAKNNKLSWLCLGPYLQNVGVYTETDEVASCIIEAEQSPRDPFYANEDVFREAFAMVMDREEYEDLRGQREDEREKTGAPWLFEKAVKHLPNFWRDVRHEYFALRRTQSRG